MSSPISTWTPQTASQPAAGWFVDPGGLSKLRWWDGSGWTEHTMDAPDVAYAAPSTPAWTPPAPALEEPLRRTRRRGRGDAAEPAAIAPAAVAPVAAAQPAAFQPVASPPGLLPAFTPASVEPVASPPGLLPAFTPASVEPVSTPPGLLPPFTPAASLALATPAAVPAVAAPGFPPPAFAAPTFEAPAFAAPVVAAQPAAGFSTGSTPYVPMSQQFSPMRSLTPMRVTGSPNTRPIWALALLPWLLVAAQAALLLTKLIYQPYYALLALAGICLVVILLVLADRAALKAQNIRPASGWWLLLSVLVYFIARWAVLRGQGVKSAAPGIVYVLSAVLSNVAIVFALPLVTGLSLPEILVLIQQTR